RGERGEPDRPRPAVLQHRQVRQRDADPVGQLGQRQAAPLQQVIDVYPHPVLLLGHQITSSNSARSAPARATTSLTARKAPPISTRPGPSPPRPAGGPRRGPALPGAPRSPPTAAAGPPTSAATPPPRSSRSPGRASPPRRRAKPTEAPISASTPSATTVP